MKKLTLTALAVASVSLFATPAMAQSSYGGSSSNSYGNSSSSVDRAQKKAQRQTAKAERKRVEALKLKEKEMARLEAAEKRAMAQDVSSATDAKMMKEHSSATDTVMMKDKDAMMHKGEFLKPTNCPSGTTAQDNGTCMLN